MAAAVLTQCCTMHRLLPSPASPPRTLTRRRRTATATTAAVPAGVLNQLQQRVVPLRAQQQRPEVPRGTEGGLQAPQMLPPDPTGAMARTGGAQAVSSILGSVLLQSSVGASPTVVCLSKCDGDLTSPNTVCALNLSMRMCGFRELTSLLTAPDGCDHCDAIRQRSRHIDRR